MEEFQYPEEVKRDTMVRKLHAQDIGQEVQKEVARIRDMISTSKALLPSGRGCFAVYDALIIRAELAIRGQDTVALIRLLPELQEA